MKADLRRWMLAVTTGETLGFAFPALAGGATALAQAPPSLVYPVMIAAGALEGALLGAGQLVGFGKTRPVHPRAWILATAFGAGVAWSIGMLPGTIEGFRFDNPLTVVLTVIGAIVLLASIPVLQWLVLRRTVSRSLFWVPANMAAWAVGILWTLGPSPFIDESTPPAVILGVYVVAGLLMAATVALVTGLAALRVIRSAAH